MPLLGFRNLLVQPRWQAACGGNGEHQIEPVADLATVEISICLRLVRRYATTSYPQETVVHAMDFGAARLRRAYLFANHRASRMNALVHDVIYVWLVARCFPTGRCVWPRDDATLSPCWPQFDTLVLGPPWHSSATPASSREACRWELVQPIAA